MARGALHTFALARQSKQERDAVRAAGLARIAELLAARPMTAAELARVLLEELRASRATTIGYLRQLHKGERSVRPTGGTQGRSALWTIGADPTLPPPSDAHERGFVPKRPRVPAQQVGMQRDSLVAALFGPARGAAA